MSIPYREFFWEVVIELQQRLRQFASTQRAKLNQRFFKTGKGEYGYGDIFLGVTMPDCRKVAKEFRDLSLADTKKVVKSKYHEERMAGLIILVQKYEKAGTEEEKEKIYKTYVDHFRFINNWDLVDVTCPRVVGQHLQTRDRKVLYNWVNSESLWTRRIAIISTLWFVKDGDLVDAFKLAKVLLRDEHDLIHKAVGWVLREAGKKDLDRLEIFLRKHCRTMPRTMLRYAIEKFPERKRQMYLKGNV
ncbi:MAG: DNA alkylation repair protein [Bdellovibrionales bacterium]|nr:DNA alkylation repair protein [Bdellovibrionales bacterium]